MKGRKPTPTPLIALRGGDMRASRRRGEPQPEVALLTRPEHVTGYAAQEWDAVAPILAQLRVLTVADRGALEALCMAYSDWRLADEAVREHGMTYETPTKDGAIIVRPRPEVAMRGEAWKRYRAALAEFGLTPSSRARLHVEPAKQESPVDAWRAKHG